MKRIVRLFTWSVMIVMHMTSGIFAQTTCRRFGGNDIEYAFQLIEDPSGNYLVTGRSYSFAGSGVPFSGDMYTIKLDSALNLLWTSVFQTPAEDQGNGIANAHGGGYLVAGSSYGNQGGYDIALVMIDTGGAMVWSKGLATPLNDHAEVIIPTSDDSYIVAGYSDSLFSGLSQSFVPFIAKLTATGSVVWARRFGFPSGVFSGTVYDVVEASDGSFLLTGDMIRQFDGSEDSDIFLARFSSSGNLLWFKWIGNNCPGCQDMGASITERLPNRYTLLASTSPAGHIWLCDFDLNGTFLLRSELPTSYFAYSRISGLAISGNRMLLAAPAFSSMLVACVDLNHQVQWASLYGDGLMNFPIDIIPKGSGYLLGGYTSPMDTVYREDYFVAELDSMGASCCMISEKVLATSAWQLPDSSGGVAFGLNFTESNFGTATSGGVQRLVCDPFPGLEEIPTARFIAFPNPFTHSLYLSFPDQQPHRVRVYNSLGMLMSEVVGTRFLSISALTWLPGVYIVQTDDNHPIKVIKE
ncbi:MAG TPA: T9SS type A sorting domain-containing protein [Bacteroidales bacterium]|nr:T9SS type A sorting domain-containing protein [Bacteroidales bacterium]HRZ49659.1 T9SS type A sorting domain-containing protein [Bacteroidales bacterium]